MGLKASGGSDHRWYFLSNAGLCFAYAMRLLPRRLRFGVAILIARAAVPFLRRTEAYEEQSMGKVDGVCEIALYLVLNTMTKNGTSFDPVFTVNGYEKLKLALATGEGVLLISPHTALSLLLVRFFHDRGHDPVVITADPEMRISGTKLTAHNLRPSQTFLVAARNRLRDGRLVCAMPDRSEPCEGRTVEFVTANGRVIVATALVQVAARCKANVVFTEVHMDKSEVVANFVTPSPGSAGSADAISNEFIEFVKAHVHARSAHYSKVA
jgi:lauroyl/myristoyl acyltransferase